MSKYWTAHPSFSAWRTIGPRYKKLSNLVNDNGSWPLILYRSLTLGKYLLQTDNMEYINLNWGKTIGCKGIRHE